MTSITFIEILFVTSSHAAPRSSFPARVLEPFIHPLRRPPHVLYRERHIYRPYSSHSRSLNTRPSFDPISSISISSNTHHCALIRFVVDSRRPATIRVSLKPTLRPSPCRSTSIRVRSFHRARRNFERRKTERYATSAVSARADNVRAFRFSTLCERRFSRSTIRSIEKKKKKKLFLARRCVRWKKQQKKNFVLFSVSLKVVSNEVSFASGTEKKYTHNGRNGYFFVYPGSSCPSATSSAQCHRLALPSRTARGLELPTSVDATQRPLATDGSHRA